MIKGELQGRMNVHDRVSISERAVGVKRCYLAGLWGLSSLKIPRSLKARLVSSLTASITGGWGTGGVKWDFGGDANTVSGYVDTAWTPPLGVFHELAHHGFDVHAYFHEGGMCFAGEFENGEVTDYNDIEYTFDGLDQLPETIVEIFNLNDMVDELHAYHV